MKVDDNEDRCHLSNEKDAPEPRGVIAKPSPTANVVALFRVGGIHHRCEWRDDDAAVRARVRPSG